MSPPVGLGQTVVVLAKAPRPGLVKTRLTPVFTPREAAALAAAATRDTLDTVVASRPGKVVVAWDGDPMPWLPAGAVVVTQRGDGLAQRLEAAVRDAFALAPQRPVLLVGMDTPQLTAGDLAVDWADPAVDAVLGPCRDGGYWVVGLRSWVPGVFDRVPMSTEQTFARQLERMRRLGLRVRQLPERVDVDTPTDAADVAAAAPDGRFGRLHARLLRTPCSPVALLDAALAGAPVTVSELGRDGARAAIPLGAWAAMRPADELIVSRCEPPVLDVGCGPGRFVEALALRGLPALGVDVSPAAIATTSARGGCGLLRDVGGRLPAEGRWGTVLLADGNIGIGGDPEGLLHRCLDLLRPGGLALVETDPDDAADHRGAVVLHAPGGRRSTPVPWARVGAPRVAELAAAIGFVAVEDWRADGRVFLALRHAA